MWLVSESPEFAVRALGVEFCGDLASSPVSRGLLPDVLREILADLVPERALYGRELCAEQSPVSGHVLVLLAPERSQFDAAVDLVRLRGGTELFCVAGAGTAMRGHHGRSWSASLGNLHLTAVFAPKGSPKNSPAALSALPSVAVCDVLREHTQLKNFGIKWVNDVLLDEAKVAGVLAHTSSRGHEVAAIVYGVGLNVEVTPRIAEDPAVPEAISLADRQTGVSLADFTLPLMLALSRRTAEWLESGSQPIVAAYRKASLVVGRRVEVLKDSRPRLEGEASLSQEVLRRGRVLELDDELQLHLDDGDPRPVRGGRLRFLPETLD